MAQTRSQRQPRPDRPDSVRQFWLQHAAALATEVLAPRAAAADREGRLWPGLLQAYRDQGFLRLINPVPLGGPGTDLLTAALVIEELAAACASSAITLSTHLMATLAILAAGTGAQQRRFLSGRSGVQPYLGIALTEPNTGSDLARVATRAVRRGKGYYLTGVKSFVMGGGLADAYTLLARTGDAASGNQGLRLFYVPAGSPGVSVSKVFRKMGLRAAPTTELYLDGVVVPEANCLGAGGQALPAVLQAADRIRPVMGAFALGLARAACTYTTGWLHEQLNRGGDRATAWQNERFALAEMAGRIAAARLLCHEAAEKATRLDPDLTLQAALAKCLCSETALAVTGMALEVLGETGATQAHPVERCQRDARVTTFLAGTNEIQRLIAARSLLGR